MNNSKTNIAKTHLSDEQIAVLNRINMRLERGDITKISKAADFTKEYVGKVLNPFTSTYNDDIINTAIELISEREQTRKENFEKLPA